MKTIDEEVKKRETEHDHIHTAERAAPSILILVAGLLYKPDQSGSRYGQAFSRKPRIAFAVSPGMLKKGLWLDFRLVVSTSTPSALTALIICS